MSTLFRTFALIASVLFLPGFGKAGDQPVVVELFTSQGCSSCPPADAHLAKLTERSDVLPLAFHVDYWDRLGWADTFATRAFTERQYAYARTFNNRSVWTPQFVVQGQHFSRGDYASMIDAKVEAHQQAGPTVSLSLREEGDMIIIEAAPLENDLPKAKVIVVHYSDVEKVKIKRGENAGRLLEYHNVVKAWRVVGRLASKKPATFEIPMEAGRPLAVLIQAEKYGPILAAQVLK